MKINLSKLSNMFLKQNAVPRTSHERARYAFDIRYNNAATNDPCAICGKRADPECGPELFLYGTLEFVCYWCGKKYDQELLEVLAVYRESRVAKEPQTLTGVVAAGLAKQADEDDEIPF
jgi:hypothetical protein